jgi:hypothetical protein
MELWVQIFFIFDWDLFFGGKTFVYDIYQSSCRSSGTECLQNPSPKSPGLVRR